MDWTNIATLIVALAAAIGIVLLLLRRNVDPGAQLSARFDRLSDQLERQDRGLRDELSRVKTEQASQAKALRDEVGATLQRMTQSLELALSKLQADNATKLEQMRQTVDEKLQGTLEKRLGESFKLVSERLEQVHKGLGEMQSLASGVGDLKKVLTNVKTRGTWGEVQLGNLLEQMLSPEQFIANAAPREGSGERVEYVVRLPGGEGELWLPIDAKFPQEDYERLIDAGDRADADGVDVASRALEARVKSFARDIRDKYINPPRTTDFALLFLPTEGLYAELLRRPGLADQLQRDYQVTICGPTTLGAILTSFRMGFRTLAIQQRSSEVWSVLGAVKAEFGRYGEILDKVNQKLREASNTIDKVNVRRRAIDRKLRDVAELPTAEARAMLELPLGEPLGESEESERDDLLA